MNSPLKNQNNESPEQEDYNLMHDNPVVKHATWMSKHAQSSRMSPLNNNNDPEKPDPKSLINEKGQSQEDVMGERKSAIDNFRKKIEGLKFNTQEQVDKANEIDAGNVNAYNFSMDSIKGVNKAYNEKVNKWNEHVAKQNQSINDILNID